MRANDHFPEEAPARATAATNVIVRESTSSSGLATQMARVSPVMPIAIATAAKICTARREAFSVSRGGGAMGTGGGGT